MDFLSAGLGIVGLGLQLFGGLQASGAAKQQAQLSQQLATISQGVTADEQAINVQKQRQMMLESNRAQLQNYRNVQRLLAQSTNAAVNQGAQYGSGLAGGLAGIQSAGNENTLGIQQGVEIGNNVFSLTSDISNKRIQMAGVQGQINALGGQIATGQGYQSLGGSLIKAGPILGAFGKDIFRGTA